MSNNQKLTPYQKFKEIMNDAAGDSLIDYQGHGRFWNTLTLDELQEVSIYGIRMIAPKETYASGPYTPPTKDDCHSKSSCCHDDKSETPATGGDGDTVPQANVSFPGRGRASGLVKGIKGEFPFDGTQFSRLPFQGTAVSPEDIQFIENWIDAGCPDEEMPKKKPIDDPRTRGEQSYEPEARTHAYKHGSGEILQRKNAQYMPADELADFRYAVAKLKSFDDKPQDTRSFLNYGKIHGDSCQHGWEQFLPWHRAYLYAFEQELQDFAPGVALPYWDWTMKCYNGGAAGEYSGVIPIIYRCWLSEEALDNLKNMNGEPFDPSLINKFKSLVGNKYNSGTELIAKCQEKAGSTPWPDTLTDEIYKQLEKTNPLFHRYRFPGMFYLKDQDTGAYILKDGKPQLLHTAYPMKNPFHHQYPTAQEIDDILNINNWAEFGGGHVANQSFGFLSQNPHNTGHIWSGGENPMADPTAPNTKDNVVWGDMFNDLVAFYDPIAYGHHSNVDRLWAKWQTMHEGKNPQDLTDIMIPWQWSIQQLLSISKLGYEYAMASEMYCTDNSATISKMKTQNTAVHEDVLQDHKRAIIRLHKVQRSLKSHYIKVFLNTPDADHMTPTEGNDNYVGYIARFGHDECVGGEGHCDVPPETTRKYDHRPRHHNTPTNHQLDATKAVKKLVEKGVKDIHVNVVALGQDGHMATGSSRLRMDGVSLNFFD